MVQEQKKPRKRSRPPPPSWYQSSRSSVNRKKPTIELALPPCNWSSSYRPMEKTDSPNNKHCGYMPADIYSSDDESVEPSTDREHKTSNAQVRPTSQHSNIKPSQCTEAIPILDDVNIIASFISLNLVFNRISVFFRTMKCFVLDCRIMLPNWELGFRNRQSHQTCARDQCWR